MFSFGDIDFDLARARCGGRGYDREQLDSLYFYFVWNIRFFGVLVCGFRENSFACATPRPFGENLHAWATIHEVAMVHADPEQ